MANLLVVDDDADLCALLRTALERDGHTVATLPRGALVTERHCAWADCILLDVMMPARTALPPAAGCGRWRTAPSFS